ncbi:MAG: Rrf2 family transcriptional regulator, partial [Synergistaceae bacterium]|nr:Rrf2 family transcriptional regulator [Synergistaceae bacterium]
MLITRETDYALRVLRALSDGEQVTVGDVCKRELLPQQFVYKILKKMEQAGFVRIARGAGGGCRLTADLDKTSLYDLVDAMKAERLVSACMQPGFQCAWRKDGASSCVVHGQLQQIQEVLDTELR